MKSIIIIDRRYCPICKQWTSFRNPPLGLRNVWVCIECGYKVQEGEDIEQSPGIIKEPIEKIAEYLLDEVCSNYAYEWSNAEEGDKEAFRHYARQILTLLEQ